MSILGLTLQVWRDLALYTILILSINSKFRQGSKKNMTHAVTSQWVLFYICPTFVPPSPIHHPQLFPYIYQMVSVDISTRVV